MVEKRAFVKLRVLDMGMKRKQAPGQFEHTVHIATFVRASIQTPGEFIGRAKILVLAMPSGGETVMLDHGVPKIGRRRFVARLAFVAIARK